MTSLLGRIFGGRAEARSEASYREAMKVSSDLLSKMREYSSSTDAARALMADIWSQNHNIPYLVTVYEASQEMRSGIEQDRPARK